MTLFGAVVSSTSLVRSIHLAGVNFRKGATGPTDATIGTTPVVPALLFDATAELASVYASLPDDIDLTQNVVLRLQWSLVNVQINNDQLDVTCDYVAPLANTTGSGPAKTSTQITGQTTVTTGNGLAINDVYTMDLTFAAGDATNPLASAVAIALELHLTNVTGVAAMHLLDGDLVYTALR